MAQREYFVYILASRSRVLYVGVTSNLMLRLQEHRMGKAENAFTARYKVTRLVYVEQTSHALEAIEREKQIKRWRREKKVALIESLNPTWRDLSGDW
jgi:putative endonuclease